MKLTGRTPIIFCILIMVLLVSGLAISLFLLHQESVLRLAAETSLSDMQQKAIEFEKSVREAQKQIEILEGKNKDADAKLNSLMDDLDLERGLREEMKEENKKIKESLETEAKAKLKIREQLSKEVEILKEKLKNIEDESSQKKNELITLQTTLNDVQKKNEELERQLKEMIETGGVAVTDRAIDPSLISVPEDQIDLSRIVVTPDGVKEGRVLNVDADTEFLIFDLGSKNGIQMGDEMSVYRGKAYLGDVKVSRVQEEMSAADFIPPFSSRKVRKNDKVIPKR